MVSPLQTSTAAAALAIITGLGSLVPVDAVITPKGGTTTYNVKIARTRSSRNAVDYHNALDYTIVATVLFPAQLSIEPKQGDKIVFESLTYAVSLVEDISSGLGSCYRLSLVSHREFKY